MCVCLALKVIRCCAPGPSREGYGPGSVDGQFEYPSALALADSKLFVLPVDSDNARVQVFV